MSTTPPVTNNCFYCGTPLVDIGGYGVRVAECPNMECKNKEKYPPSSAMMIYMEKKNANNYTASNNQNT